MTALEPDQYLGYLDMVSRVAKFFLDQQYRILRFRLAFLLYFLIIAFGSIPHARTAVGHVAPGVILHLLAYSLITALLLTGTTGALFRKSWQALLIVALMGALDEWVQSFFSYRTAAMGDWLVDCSAGIMTILLFSILWPVNPDS